MSRSTILAHRGPALSPDRYCGTAADVARPLVLARFDPGRLADTYVLTRSLSILDGLEVDIQVCRSGEPVIFPRDRLTVDRGRATYISDCRLPQARELAAHTGAHLVTLAELLALLARSEQPRFLSLRLLRREGAPFVLRVLQRAAIRGEVDWERILISSPMWSEVARVRDLMAGVSTALVTEHADTARISFLHDLGTRVFVWKARSETDVHRAAASGADGVMLDRLLPLGPRARDWGRTPSG